jgi:protein phosphatase
MCTSLYYETGNATDVGRKRSENQDYFGAYDETPYGDLWVVCDGMGGAAGGRTASTTSVDAIRESIHTPGDGEVAALLTAMEAANRRVFKLAQADASLEGMGTTAVLLLIHDEKAFVAHVGDSRVYMIRDGELRQLTTDHTMVQGLLDNGKLTPEEAKNHPDSNIITRSVGIAGQVEVDVDVEAMPLRPADRFVLCTDGLSGLISDEIIASIAVDLPPQKACRMLVKLANDAGGPDNITVQIVEVLEAPRSLNRGPLTTRLPFLSKWSQRQRVAALSGAVAAVALALGIALYADGGDTGEAVQVAPEENVDAGPAEPQDERGEDSRGGAQ